MNSVEAAPVVSDGLCLAFGGTNARQGNFKEGELYNHWIEQTPDNHEEFFGWMARHILESADKGSEWLVAGFPGPVNSRQGDYNVGPFANIPALSGSAYLLGAELHKSDPAAGRLLESGFKVVAVNDGELAAHAVAERFSKPEDETVGALIVGTGIGFGAVKRTFFGTFNTVTLPLEVGHVPITDNPLITFESTFSGPALERTYGASADKLDVNHPAWETVGKGIGRIATMVSLLTKLDLVVPTGGVGAGAVKNYKRHLEDFMYSYRSYATATANMFRPRFDYVPAKEAQTFELRGAPSIIRSSL